MWYYYQSTIRKTIEYPLLASTLSEKECIIVEAPAIKVALNMAGMPSNFPRAVISGPLEDLGLDSPTLYGTNGIKKVRTIMDHGDAETITGQHMRAELESHKLEFGCGTSSFTNNFRIFKECVTKTWWRHAWEFMWKAGTVIKEETPNLQKQRENDTFLMQELAVFGYRGHQLAMLNRCCIYMQ
eukprot:622080-Ditylum_brightwellii.AAC.1